MKYVVLKNSLSFLCVQLPEGFGEALEIVCFESQKAFEKYLKENPAPPCQISFAQPASGSGELDVNPSPCRDGIYIRHNDYYKKVFFSEILWVEAARSYCSIKTAGKENYIVAYPLVDVKKKLPSALFIQTHRSYLVNADQVAKFIGNVLYVGEQSIPISRKFKKEVLEHFTFLDNIKDTLGKEIPPSGKPNPPLGKKIRKSGAADVTSDDEDLSSGKDK